MRSRAEDLVHPRDDVDAHAQVGAAAEQVELRVARHLGEREDDALDPLPAHDLLEAAGLAEATGRTLGKVERIVVEEADLTDP